MSVLKKIGHLFKTICTILGAILLLTWFLLLMFRLYFKPSADIDTNSALVVDFNIDFPEQSSSDILSDILGKPDVSFQKLIQSIEIAATDDRIKALIAKINITSLEMAQIQDVAKAVSNFRKSNKKTYVFSQGFGNFGYGNREYYLATFFDNIYMQPHTDIGLTGVHIEVPFFKKLLEKIGVKAEFYSRYEYKTAMMSLTDEHMSKEYKQELLKLGKSLWSEVNSGIQENRILKEDIDIIRDRAPISSEEGLRLGLIDEVLYLPEVERKIKETGIKNFIRIEDYAQMFEPNSGNIPVIAWLNLSGIIVTGKSSENIDGEFTSGSESVLQELQKIGEIENLKALVVRIDSPGGSYQAADEIYFALQNLKKERNIPIIISQSGYAASGGYYVSLAGDYIFAEPTTITGSIGVLGGKVSLADLWQKMNINWEDIKIGKNSDILSINKPFSASEKEVFNASLDNVYQDFTQKVVERRKLAKDIDKIARGRVFSGREALELGLIDELGGYGDALLKAKELSSINKNTKFRLSVYPREKNFTEKICDMFANQNITIERYLSNGIVDIRDLKLFKRLQYDTVLAPFVIKM